MNEDTLDVVVEQLKIAKQPEDVFGLFPSVSIEDQKKLVTKQYHRLAKCVAPDLFAEGSNAYIKAEASFKQLTAFRNAALEKLADGTYGKKPQVAVISARGVDYALEEKLWESSTYTCYKSGSCALKIVKSIDDNDLLERDKQVSDEVLLTLSKEDKGQIWIPTTCEVKDSFLVKVSSGRKRVNIYNYQDNVLSLGEIKHKLGKIDGRTSGWMWKRIIGYLSWVEKTGYVHGGVLPNTLFTRPDNWSPDTKDLLKHAVVWTDFSFATKIGTQLSAYDTEYKSFYPPEVFKKLPVTSSCDIYMAAKTMLYMIGGDVANNTFPSDYPKQLQTMLEFCLDPRPSYRMSLQKIVPATVSILEQAYGPRKWHQLNVKR